MLLPHLTSLPRASSFAACAALQAACCTTRQPALTVPVPPPYPPHPPTLQDDPSLARATAYLLTAATSSKGEDGWGMEAVRVQLRRGFEGE